MIELKMTTAGELDSTEFLAQKLAVQVQDLVRSERADYRIKSSPGRVWYRRRIVDFFGWRTLFPYLSGEGC